MTPRGKRGNRLLRWWRNHRDAGFRRNYELLLEELERNGAGDGLLAAIYRDRIKEFTH